MDCDINNENVKRNAMSSGTSGRRMVASSSGGVRFEMELEEELENERNYSEEQGVGMKRKERKDRRQKLQKVKTKMRVLWLG